MGLTIKRNHVNLFSFKKPYDWVFKGKNEKTELRKLRFNDETFFVSNEAYNQAFYIIRNCYEDVRELFYVSNCGLHCNGVFFFYLIMKEKKVHSHKMASYEDLQKVCKNFDKMFEHVTEKWEGGK